jgi:integrase
MWSADYFVDSIIQQDESLAPRQVYNVVFPDKLLRILINGVSHVKILAQSPQGRLWAGPGLKSNEFGTVLRLASARNRMPEKAEVTLCVFLYLGLRAKEIASLRWGDVFDEEGKPHSVMHLKSAYTKGNKTRDVYPLILPYLLLRAARRAS